MVVVFWYPRRDYDKTRENRRKTHREAFHSTNQRPEQKPTSSLINMRSAALDTHQPKSTIFAHLLGLPRSLSPTKEKNKYATSPKTFLCADKNGVQGETWTDCETICRSGTLLKNDCGFRKVARRRPVGNHVGEWRAAPSERKYLATTPQLSLLAYINYGTSDLPPPRRRGKHGIAAVSLLVLKNMYVCGKHPEL